MKANVINQRTVEQKAQTLPLKVFMSE